MKRYTLYNAKLGTCKSLTEEQMQEAKKFYGIDFPAWDEYYQRHDENSLHNARGDIFLWITDEQITLELKQKEKAEYSLGGVVKCKIAIIDAEIVGKNKHRFPNLACMKISSFYKSQGNEVVLKTDYENLAEFDKVFISKVFTSTEIDESILTLENVEYGGTGFFL